MKDKYCLTRKENVFLAKKRWTESIFSGMHMENRNITFPQTQTILEGINVPEVSLDDIQAVLNMRDAWSFLLAHLDDTLDIGFLCRLQERVAFREALAWGELRTGTVGISGVAYTPPIPDAALAERELLDLTAAPFSKTEYALDLFAWITRSQLFWDGNKRTAVLAANKVLIKNGLGILLVREAVMNTFNTLLSTFYETGDAGQLKGFLYESCLLGIEFDEPSEKELTQSMPVIDKEKNAVSQEKAGSARRGRNAEWLKCARAEKNITQKELAEAIGTSTSAIANIEQGQRKGSDAVWCKIEHYLGAQ